MYLREYSEVSVDVINRILAVMKVKTDIASITESLIAWTNCDISDNVCRDLQY